MKKKYDEKRKIFCSNKSMTTRKLSLSVLRFAKAKIESKYPTGKYSFHLHFQLDMKEHVMY